MIYSGINNYCETIKLKKQMGTITSEDVDCESKTTFTTEEISKMVNLGNSKVLENTYDGTLTYLKVESNGHIFILENGKFVEEGEIAFTPGECFAYEDITLVESFDINYDTCVIYMPTLDMPEEMIDLYCKGESVDGYNMKDDINNGNLDINELEENNVVKNVIGERGITITGYNTECGGYDVVIPENIEEKKILSIFHSSFNNLQIKSVIIPNSVIAIGEDAFLENQLTGVTIGNSVTTIGVGAFANNQLTSVTIPDSVITIGDSAFENNQLTNVTIPNSVTTIGDYVFYRNQLTNITIGNSVMIIENFAFYGNQLTNVTIPNSVTTIGNCAFKDNQLINLTIPNSVTTIGTDAFCNNKLASLDLSNLTNIQSISHNAFWCNPITSENFIGINEYNYDYFDFSCIPQ